MIQQQPPPQLPAREEVSATQIHQLLAIVHALQPYVLVTHREVDNTPMDIDGGTVMAAAHTFATVCNRLDSIVSDPARWDLKAQDTLYESMTKHFDAATEVHKSQVETLKGMRRPSTQFKPQFTKVANQLFVAYWGDLTDPDSLIMGKGATPDEALVDFDAAFQRLIDKQVKFSPEAEAKLRARATGEPAPEPPTPPKRKAGRSRKTN